MSLPGPGQATSERATLELEMIAALNPALDEFTRQVTRLALDSSGEPFTLGVVLGSWVPVVEALVGVLRARDLPREYLAAAYRRLQGLDLPALTYDSARVVLTLAAEQHWPRAKLKAELATALDPETPFVQTVVTAALQPGPAKGVSARALARTAARTEATAAYGHAALRVIAAFGRPFKKWVAHHDNRTRPTHAAVDGEQVPTDMTFIVGNYGLMYPGDPSAPPELVANCRCVMVAVGKPTKLLKASQST